MAHTETGIAVENFIKEEVRRRAINANASVRESGENLGFTVHLQGPGIKIVDLNLPSGYAKGLDNETKEAITSWLDLLPRRN
jgi:hypothetical protein